MATGDDQIETLWAEATRLEDQEQFLAAVRVYENIIRLAPTDSRAYWHIARTYTGLADSLPLDDEEQRTTYFTLAEQWADRGLAVDAECGECCLYKVGGLGGRLKARGMLAAAADAPVIAKLLERGIALLSARPGHQVDPELEELYYAAAQFYRMVPDWFWLKWVIGVRGSRRLAVEYMRKANEIATNIAGPRPQLMVELGAALLCLGEEEDDPALVAEGHDVLDRVIRLEPGRPRSPVDEGHARILTGSPGKACTYSRDAWISNPPVDSTT